MNTANTDQVNTLKAAFVAWCVRHGYTSARSVHSLSPVGTAALVRRKGKFAVEVASALDSTQQAMLDAGFTHGYDYPAGMTPRAAADLTAWLNAN